MTTIRVIPLLGACIALALAGTVAAQTTAPKARSSAGSDAATQAQLDAARRDLDAAARRVAELSRKLGYPERPEVTFKRRVQNKPVIGVVLAPDAQAGVRVAGITPDSGAAKAGLKAGDRITAVSGTPVLGSTGELRMENARKLFTGLDDGKPVRIDYVRAGKAATVSVTPRLDQDVFWIGGPGEPSIVLNDVPGVGDGIRQEIIRIGPRGDCKGQHCKVPMIAEAFRWSGLNLASVDAKLGRYFGTDRGVLVLSAGEELVGLQPGDVIQKIDGKSVASPRDAMEALRAKEPNAMVLVEYMRDRRTASTRVKVPEALPFKVPAPPRPPLPPAPPRAMKAVPPVPPPPPPAAAFIDDDGVVTMVRGEQYAWVRDEGDVESVVTEDVSTTADGKVVRNVRIETK